MKRTFKRPVAFAMAVAISASMLPSMVFAADTTAVTHNVAVKDVKLSDDASKFTYTEYCTDEGCTWSRENETAATKSNATVAATCTEDGQDVYFGTVEGQKVYATVAIPATGHVWDTNVTTQTYTYDGTDTTAAAAAPTVTRTYYACTNGCTEVKDEEINITAPTQTIATPCESGDSHDQATAIITISAASCTAKGEAVEYTYCSTCGKYIDAKVVETPVAEHTWGTAVETVVAEPTCISKGITKKTSKCEKCEATNEEFVETDMKAHEPEWKEISNTATCTTAGVATEAYLCKNCGAQCEEVITGYTTRTKTVAALNHKYETTKENVVEATCGKSGSYEMVTKCTVCGDQKSVIDVTVPATGKHTYAEETTTGIVWQDVKVISGNDAPTASLQTVKTCTVCGKTELVGTAVPCTVKEDTSKYVAPVYSCAGGSKTFDATVTVDGKTYTDTKTFTYVEKETDKAYIGNHQNQVTAEEITKEATCTEDGEKAVVTRCKDCGAIVGNPTNVTIIPAKGHDYGEYVVTNPATYTNEGVETKTCTVCGDEQTKTIAKLTVTKQKLGYVHNVATKRMQVNFQKFNPGDDYSVKYQIRYATNKSFTKGVKNKYTVKSTKTISGLTKGKTYYVKVRTHVYDADGNEVARGKYSEVTKITIKK